MRRFFCSAKDISDDEIIIRDPKEIHHILHVVRLKIKDKLIIFDGREKEYRGVIDKVLNDKLIIKIKDSRVLNFKKDLKLTLACAIPKRKKMDYIVEKTTELGVDEIIPLKTQRTVVKLDKDRESLKLTHWQGIAKNAAKQSKRTTIPKIKKIMDFKDALFLIKEYDLALLASLAEEKRDLKQLLNALKPKNVLIFIGPEGDFSPREIRLAKGLGCRGISLGKLVLKVDTACIAILSMLNYALKL